MSSRGISKKASKKASEKVSRPSKSAPKSKETVSDDSSSGSEEEQPAVNRSWFARQSVDKYQPPDTFAPFPIGNVPAESPFSAKNLEGKELWLITAPTTAPLSKLNEVNPLDVVHRKPVIEAKSGRKFCLQSVDGEVKDASRAALMFPDSKGIYRLANKTIKKAYRVAESEPMTVLTISRDDIPSGVPVRLQPDGLKMRFRPIGADPEDENRPRRDTGSTMDNDDVRSSQTTIGTSQEGGRRKKRHKISLGEDGGTRRKKRRTEEEEG